MDEISELIKEAKPLYYKRKRRVKTFQTMTLTLVIVLVAGIGMFGGYSLNQTGIKTYYETSATQDSYIPVDEYGLITVEY